MKITQRMQLWDLKREIKFYEGKVRFLKQILKHFKTHTDVRRSGHKHGKY